MPFRALRQITGTMRHNDLARHNPTRIAHSTLHDAAHNIGASDNAFFIWAAFHACRLLDMNENRIEAWSPAIGRFVFARGVVG